MLFSLIVFILCLNHPLFAVDLNIHKSATEVRQALNGIGTYDYVFQNGEYENIIDGSIDWDGTPFIKLETYKAIDTLKDALVTVRKSSVCECNAIQAKIIDPKTLLLQNVQTGAYFYADAHSIEYKSKQPGDNGTILTIEFKNKTTKYSGTLSYLMKGITWLPNYDLFVTNGNTCNLRGYAVIRNNQQQEYQINNTDLYSGDLQLINNPSPTLFRPVALASVQSSASSQSIQLAGEEQGFYFYALKVQYTLRPASSVRLPFITSNPKCQFYYKTTTSISAGQYNGVFERTYDLTPDQFLPSGIFTVRDNQVLIGQSNLPDVPKNYTQTFTLGQDNDVRFAIKGNLTGSSKANATVSSQTYALDVTISNYENTNVKGQLDFYGAVHTTINKTTCTSAKVDGTMINLSFDIKQGGSYHCQINVTLKWG